jgi:hypothetical protein
VYIIDAAGQVGRIVVDQSQILFSSFHFFVMKAVDVSKSALSPSQPKLSHHFCQWDSGNFHGEESLDEVCTRLKFPKVSITSYLKFLEHTPMLNLLFHGYHLYGNLYSVALFMSFNAFTRYLHQTSCHIDYEVELCGFNDESIAKCGRCKANRDAVSCEMVHSNSCPYLLSLFPELHDEVNSDILHLMDLGSSYPIVDSEVDCYVKLHCDEGGSSMQSFGSTSPDNFVNSLPTTEDSVPIKKDSLITKGIPLELVSVMLDEALKFAKACHFGQCSQLPSIVHVTSQSQSDGYMFAPFVSPETGNVTGCSIGRLQAAKYCAQCGYLLVNKVDVLFIPFHCFMVKVIDLVLESYLVNTDQKCNASLDLWVQCNFSGAESFNVVRNVFNGIIVQLSDCMMFLRSLPQMKLFFNYCCVDDSEGIAISFIMAFDAFQLYNQHCIWLPDHVGVDEEGLEPFVDLMVPPQTFCYFATSSTQIPSNTNISLESNVNWTPPITRQSSR